MQSFPFGVHGQPIGYNCIVLVAHTFWNRPNPMARTRQAETMKRRCNSLILQGALALLLVVQSVALRDGPDALQKDIDESVRSLTKRYRDEDWSGDNNEDEIGLFQDEIDADVGAAEESHRMLKGKKGKKPMKEKKMPTPAPYGGTAT
jgi:hypothetical protein